VANNELEYLSEKTTKNLPRFTENVGDFPIYMGELWRIVGAFIEPPLFISMSEKARG
jgi:hypothetical protein